MKTEETTVKKGHNGWEAETIVEVEKKTYALMTSKSYNGHLFSTAHEVVISNSGGYTTTTYLDMMNAFFSMRHNEYKRSTEKTVREAHTKFLLAFDEKVKQMPSEEFNQEPEIGDILFLDGYDKTFKSPENNHIIYKIEGTKCFTVEAETLELNVHNYVKPYSKKFGIGIYYDKSHNMQSLGIDENKLSDMLIEAQDVKRETEAKLQKAQEEAKKKAEEKQKYLSQFKTASIRETTNIIKKHILANYDVSKVFVKTDSYANGSSMDVTYVAPSQITELERFIKSFQYGYFDGMNDIYEYHDNDEIILDGYILKEYKYVFARWQEGPGKPKPKQSSEPKTEQQSSNSIQVIEYSEKAIAVIGDTKPIKDDLKSLGGRFNPRLSCGAGWIFPKTKKDDITNYLNL